MKRALVVMLVGMLTVAAQATLIDDFGGDLSAYTNTVILNNSGGATVSTWQISGGKLELDTSAYGNVDQQAFIYNGLSLAVGQEVQVNIVHNGGSQDLGLYVGGVAPTTGVRESYVNVYARNNTDVFSRGFTYVVGGSHEMNLKGGTTSEPAYDKLFIKRDGINDYEAGYYNGSTRIVIADRNGLTDIDGSYVGFYSDVRAVGTLGSLDNLTVVPEPATMLLLGLGAVALRRRK